MYDQYEFMRAKLDRQGNKACVWKVITENGEKTIEVPVKSDSVTLDFLNIVGKKGWHFGTRSSNGYDFLQRKKNQ